jgi:hypothetical protein
VIKHHMYIQVIRTAFDSGNCLTLQTLMAPQQC